MAQDEKLAARVRGALGDEPGLSERRMFGGLAFLVEGHLAVAASDEGLMVRCDPDDAAVLLREAHVRPMEMRGRTLRGWVRLEPAGCADDEDLARWARVGTTYARGLPPKDPAAS